MDVGQLDKFLRSLCKETFPEEGILYGDATTPVSGVLFCWMANVRAMRRAIEEDCNVIVCHESLFLGLHSNMGVPARLADLGAELLLGGETEEYTIEFCADLGIAFCPVPPLSTTLVSSSGRYPGEVRGRSLCLCLRSTEAGGLRSCGRKSDARDAGAWRLSAPDVGAGVAPTVRIIGSTASGAGFDGSCSGREPLVGSAAVCGAGPVVVSAAGIGRVSRAAAWDRGNPDAPFATGNGRVSPGSVPRNSRSSGLVAGVHISRITWMYIIVVSMRSCPRYSWTR